MATDVGERRFSSEELALDILSEEEWPAIAFLVWDEVHDQHKDEVDDAFLDDSVHLDLFQTNLARFLQRLRVRTIDRRLCRSTLLQDFFVRTTAQKITAVKNYVFETGF